MNLWYAIILGIVEGVTEFLPISSTGHLMLTSQILGLDSTEFVKSFEIAIQLGAILSVVVLYWKSLILNFKILKRVMAAFIPTSIVGLVLYKIVKKILLSSTNTVLWSLFLGGIFMVIFELIHKEKSDVVDGVEKISYRQAILIGMIQSLAMIPGVSRAAATIYGGLFLGIKRKTIVEFSFLLAIPTMAAATALDLLKSAHSFSSDQFSFLAVGFAASFVVAFFSVKFLLYFVKSHNLMAFGIYRIAVSLGFRFL